MDILLTNAQLEYAQEHFLSWLKNSSLGGDPENIEIAKSFLYDGKTYLIFKFNKEGDSNSLVGVCGGFIPGVAEDSGCVWSEFEPFNDNCEEKCKGYIETIKNKTPDYFFKFIDVLKDYGKWNEMLKEIDDNIDKFRMPREQEGKKCYQFFNVFDFHYYAVTSKEQFSWVKSDEAILLQRKLYALIELGDERAQEVLDELKALVPCCASNLFEQLEIYKKMYKLSSYREELEKIYSFIWRARDFARYLRAHSWVDIEEKKYESAMHYLSWSLIFDESERSFDYANSEIDYIKSKMGVEKIERPELKESSDYFIKNSLPRDITQENMSFAWNLYEFYLTQENSRREDVEFAKQNLIDLGRIWGTSKVDTKLVEVKVRTPNKLIVNFSYRVSFQILKEYSAVNNIGDNICQIFMYDEEHAQISLKEIGDYTSSEEYTSLVDKHISEVINNGGTLVSNEFVPLESDKISKLAKRILYTLNDGNTYANYYCKINSQVAGVITYKYTENDEIDKEARKILSTLEEF